MCLQALQARQPLQPTQKSHHPSLLGSSQQSSKCSVGSPAGMLPEAGGCSAQFCSDRSNKLLSQLFVWRLAVSELRLQMSLSGVDLG